MDTLTLFDLLPLVPDLLLEHLALLLVLFDQFLDLLLVEVLDFDKAVLLVFGFHQLLL
jgi:hypothetical protein